MRPISWKFVAFDPAKYYVCDKPKPKVPVLEPSLVSIFIQHQVAVDQRMKHQLNKSYSVTYKARTLPKPTK